MDTRASLRAWLLLPLIAGGALSAPAQKDNLTAVFLKDNNVYTIGASGEPKQLTSDGIRKGVPLWSGDGTKIAFLREIDEKVALDNLIVIDSQTGKQLADIRICPVLPNVGYAVNRIDGIEWLTNNTIAATGSLNPSTAQTFVFDIRTGQGVMDYIDDDAGAVFSPDGEHAACLRGSQHFLPDADRRPELWIDGRRAFPGQGAHAVLLSKPAWSEDSTSVAFVAENYRSKRRSLVVCGLKSACDSVPLSTEHPDPDDRFEVEWRQGRVYLTFPEEQLPGQPEAKTWSWKRGEARPVPSTLPKSSRDIADHLTAGLQDRVIALDGKDADFWCSNCALAKLNLLPYRKR